MNEAKKAEEIRKHVLELLAKQGNKLDNFTVQFDDGVVVLAGQCDTTKTRDKALLMAKNEEGVKEVRDGGLQVPQVAAPTPPPAAAPTPAPAPAQNSAPGQFAAAAGSAFQAATRAAAPAPAAPQAQPAQPVTPPAAAPQAPAQPAAAPAETTYTVQAGDTLSKIAKQFYGDANKYMVIFEANKDMLKDPDKIRPGQTLRIPAKK